MEKLLEETELLDYSSSNIMALITQKGWEQLSDIERVKQIYHYVRDDI